jgi:uncharacterized protein YndB with AHSA1/START domain
MTTATNELSLTTSRLIKASPQQLYDAWLDPKLLVQFMLPGDDMTCPKAVTDPRVGGRYEIVMRGGDQDIPHTGEYLVLEPHKRIAFTWHSPFADYDSEVRLSFTPEDGGTLVELTHVKFRDAQLRDNHEAGWKKILEALEGVYA